MINAMWDKAVPKASTVDMWEECGKPDITWLPTGHPTLWIFYPYITRRILRFLNHSFDGTTIA